jgi:hypothetical protein
MADDTRNITARTSLGPQTNQIRYGVGVMLDVVVEVAAAANANSTYTVMRLPTDARIHGTSELVWDDLTDSGSPTLDIGIAPVDGSVTADPDAINDGLVLSSAGTGARMIKDATNWGKYLWEIAGLSADPGGFVDITLKIVDAATVQGGTIAMCVHYTTE